MSSKIIVITNEDGDVYGAVIPNRSLTKLGALRAINKELDNWGTTEDVEIHLEDLEISGFWETSGGEYDGWQWWTVPDKNKYKFDSLVFLGTGWIYKVY